MGRAEERRAPGGAAEQLERLHRHDDEREPVVECELPDVGRDRADRQARPRGGRARRPARVRRRARPPRSRAGPGRGSRGRCPRRRRARDRPHRPRAPATAGGPRRTRRTRGRARSPPRRRAARPGRSSPGPLAGRGLPDEEPVVAATAHRPTVPGTGLSRRARRPRGRSRRSRSPRARGPGRPSRSRRPPRGRVSDRSAPRPRTVRMSPCAGAAECGPAGPPPRRSPPRGGSRASAARASCCTARRRRTRAC